MKQKEDTPDFIKDYKPLSDEKIKELLEEGMEIRKSIEKATKSSVSMCISYKNRIG